MIRKIAYELRRTFWGLASERLGAEVPESVKQPLAARPPNGVVTAIYAALAVVLVGFLMVVAAFGSWAR